MYAASLWQFSKASGKDSRAGVWKQNGAFDAGKEFRFKLKENDNVKLTVLIRKFENEYKRQ